MPKGNLMKTGLLLIDIQNDYFPGGAMECEGSIKAGENAGKILKYAREHAILPIYIRHLSLRPGSTFLLPDTHGSEIYSGINPLPTEIVIIKHYPNSFRDTSLLEVIRKNEIKELIITGMMTHMCIDTTVRAAADLDLSCILVHDACATRDLPGPDILVPAKMVHAAFIGALSGFCSKVYSTNEILNSSELSDINPD
jgi:nicotinamidase-related amidase